VWEAIGQGVCIMGIAASKGSVAIFLLHIVRSTWHVAFLWFCIVSTSVLCVITTTSLFLQCRPAAFQWDKTITGGNCWLNVIPVGLIMAGMCSSLTTRYVVLTTEFQPGQPQWTSYSPSSVSPISNSGR
jgi:hypothetical protein